MPYYDFPNLDDEQRAFYRSAAIQEASAQHQRNLVAEAEAIEAKKKSDIESAKKAEQHRAAMEAQRRRDQAELRETSRKNLEKVLEMKFFQANPSAGASDWLNAKDKIIENHFISAMEGRSSIEEKERAKYPKM